MRKLFIGSLIIAIHLTMANAQTIISGTTYNQKEKTPLPYVNIGIQGTSVGTSSFENGDFRITIPDSFKNDSLTFSMIGFKSAIKAITHLSESGPVSIMLDEDVVVLKEIVVKSSKTTIPIRLGLSGASQSAIAFGSPEGGAAMALLLNEENKTIVLEKATVDVSKNELPEFKLRCRIMEVENGKPGRDLLSQSVIISSTITKGLVTVNLSPYNLVIDKPFFLVFEWILDKATSDYFKNILENRPAWWPAGAAIHNRNTVVLFDAQRNIIKKIPMTKAQQAEYEVIRKRETEFSTKPSKLKCFARSSSLGNWNETQRDVVCFVIGY